MNSAPKPGPKGPIQLVPKQASIQNTRPQGDRAVDGIGGARPRCGQKV